MGSLALLIAIGACVAGAQSKVSKLTEANCMHSTEEVGANSLQGLLMSNGNELAELPYKEKLFYQARKFTICTTSDGERIVGFQMTLLGASRGDEADLPLDRLVNWKALPPVELSMLGEENDHCQHYTMSAGDSLSQIVVKHTGSAIHVIQIETAQGGVFRAGSA